AVMTDVLNHSTGGSWVSQTHIHQRVISRRYDDPFKLALMLKDIRIATELGRAERLPTPLAALTEQLWRAAALGAGPEASGGAAGAGAVLGRRVSRDATIAVLERCRVQAAAGGPVVRFVFASSIAVFGTPLPPRIDDATAPAPTLSYGTHKRVVELLIDDAT